MKDLFYKKYFYTLEDEEDDDDWDDDYDDADCCYD